MSDDTDDYTKLNALRVDALYSHSVIPVAVMLCGAVILICMLWNKANAAALLTWLVVLLVVTAARYLMVFKYRSTEKIPEQYSYWLNMYFAGSVLSGVVWGAAAYVFISNTNIVDIGLLTMFIIVVAAGSIGIYSIFQRVYYGFNLSAVVPLVVYLLSRNDELINMLGAVTIVFTGFVFVIQYDAHKVINQLLVVELDNRFLLDGYERDQQSIRKFEMLNRNKDEELKKMRVELGISRDIIEKLRAQLKKSENGH